MQEFIDQLSNWYVRRSRRRFWKSENDADKLGGYITLHTCLVTLAKLMAPLAPFVSEEMYQNLVCEVEPGAADSVHLAEFPVADMSLADQPLMEATRLAMRIASMGRGARSKAGIKVRQPLASVAVKTRALSDKDYLALVQDQILEELNIKELRALDESSNLWQRAQRAAGEEPETTVQLDDHVVALEGGYAVAIDTTISPELAEEGLARELVHRIQNLRRAADFEVTDRIVTYFQAPDEISRVMRGNFADYIRQETLSEELVGEEPHDAAKSESLKVDGMEVTLGVRRL
jgi:isoleucyl-tRNA synthetase